MAAVGEQDHVAGFEDAAFEVGLVVIVEIDPHLAGFDEEHLLGELSLASHGVVNVGGDHVALGAVHVPELLGEISRSKKTNSVVLKLRSKYQSQGPPAMYNLTKIGGFHNNAQRGVIATDRVYCKLLLLKNEVSCVYPMIGCIKTINDLKSA